MAARHLREHAVDSRQRRWFWIRTALLCWLFGGAGLVLVMWAFHVTDEGIGRILLLSGQLVALVGIVATVWRAIWVAQERGWL